MATIVSIQQGGTGANNASDAVNALGTIANTGGIFTGEVQFKGQNNSINVANSAVISGNANISGNLRVTNQGFFGNGIAAHIAAKSIEANTIRVAGFANTNGASEIMVINKSNGSLAYAEFIALNDKANQEQGWISVGINSSEYNDPDFTLTGPDDGYLLFEPPLNSNANGDLIIGTGSNGLNNHIKLAAGGFSPTDAQMIISPADLKTAEITNSVLTSNVATLTTANTHTFIANDQVVIASVGAPYDGTFTISSVTSNTFSYAVTNNNVSPSAESGTATQYLPFNKGTVQLTAQLFVGENSKSTIETADITLAEGHAIPLGIVVDNDGPGQTVMFNKSNGTLAYSEFIAHNDAGNVEMGWISMGINSSGYDDPEYPITKADDAYILYEPPANTSGDGDLIIGTGTNGTKNRLIFAAEGFDEANAQVIITPNESVRVAINTNATSSNTGALQVAGGIGVAGSVYVQGNQTIQGDLIVNGTQTIQSIDSVAASGPISILGDGNSANTWDFGVVGTYAVSKSSSIQAITNKSLANNSATLTTANNHSFSVEDIATITGVDATFNGVHRITAVTSNTFSYFKLANNISSTAATGNVSVGLTTKYTGIIKDTSNSIWKLVSNIEARPAFNINFANTALDNLRVATINANSFVTAAGLNVTDQANNAYAAANNAVLKTGDTMTGVLNIANATALITTGNVGIGTTNPGYKLNVVGSTGFNGNSTVFDNPMTNNWGLRVQNTNTGGWGVSQYLNLYGYASSPAAAFDVLQIRASYPAYGQVDFLVKEQAQSTAIEALSIVGNGKIGIGTTNPVDILDVRGGSFYFNRGTGNLGNRYIYINKGASNDGGLLLSQDNTLDWQILNNITTGDLGFYSYGASAQVFLIKRADGNVGIGTTSPVGKLHVSAADTNNTFLTNSAISITNSNSAAFSRTMGINFSVGAGATSEIISGIYGVYTNYSTSVGGALAFVTNNGSSNFSEKMRITSSGAVGIGTTNPNNARLHVAGVNISPDLSTASVTNASAVLGNSDSDYGMYFATYGAGNGAIQQRRGASAVYYDLTLQPHGGNVGVGTLTPSVKFHVAGASIIANNTSIDPDSYASQTVAGAIADGSGWGVTSAIGGNAGTGDSWAIGHNGSGLFMGMQNGSATNTMQTYVQFETNRNLLLVPTSGNVGVGSTTPDAKLRIITSSTVQGMRVTSSNDWGNIVTPMVDFDGNANGGGDGNILRLRTGAARTDVEIFEVVNGNGTQFLVRGDGNVGIGTTSPYSRLQIYQSSSTLPAVWLYRGTQGADVNLPVAFGNPYLIIGASEYQLNSVQSIGFGYVAANGNYPPAEIGFKTTSTSGQTYGDIIFGTRSVYTNTAVTERMRISSDGYVGIGTTNPSRRLHIYGDFNDDSALRLEHTDSNNRLRLDLVHPTRTFTMSNNGTNWSIEHNGSDVVTVSSGGSMTLSGTLTENSSIAIKENVDPISNALDSVLKLVGVTYDRIDGSAKKRAGLIAEEVDKVLPNVVQKDENGNPSGIQYTNLIAYLVESIKELKAEIDVLKSK